MPAAAGIPPKKNSYPSWLALSLILVILASVIFAAMRHLRGTLVQQIAQQDGYVLYAASKVQIDPEFARDPELRPVAIENKALEAAQLLSNIIAMRLFDAEGNPHLVFPPGVKPGVLSPDELERARALNLASEFHESVELSTLFTHLAQSQSAPILRVIVPLESEKSLIGIAEFFMDGRNVQTSVRALDRDMWRYGILIFAIGGGITALSLAWAFGRLQRSNRLLAQRTQSLLRANHELTLAAKTSAVGAIASHLIHDLKSPLFGLQSFVSAKGSDSGDGDENWNLAISTTQRMQKLINDIVRILQEEKTTPEYELTVQEVLGLLRSKLEPAAREARLKLTTDSASEAILPNRHANIVLLIITNLGQNAIQATPAGGEVRIRGFSQEDRIVFEVQDSGPGLPESLRDSLFTPSRSTKEGGTGLGLAISKQLANHLGAHLALKQTSSAGTTFVLALPEHLLAAEPELTSP